VCASCFPDTVRVSFVSSGFLYLEKKMKRVGVFERLGERKRRSEIVRVAAGRGKGKDENGRLVR
jgi:hypothetical protein